MTPFVFPSPAEEPAVILEDPDFVVARKPCGMHTSTGSARPAEGGEGTLLSWVVQRYPETLDPTGWGKVEGGLLHRLDRETSGLVLFARSEEAFRALQAASERGEFRKTYVAKAVPRPSGLEGCRPELSSPSGIDAEIWRRGLENDRESGGELPGAADSLASLIGETIEENRDILVEGLFRAYGPGAARVACAVFGEDLGKKKNEWGLVLYRTRILEARAQEPGRELELRVELTRGFRHQVRAHLAWIGLPLLGDSRYGGGGADRLYLHAAALVFPHPRTGKRVEIAG